MDLSGSERRPNPFRWLDTLDFNRFHLLLLFFTVSSAVAAGYNAQIVSYILPFVLKEWQLTTVEAGTLVSYVFLGLMVGSIGFGVTSDYLGRKRTLVIALTVLSLFSGSVYFAPNFFTFCLLRFCAGIGIGGIVPLAVALFSEFSPAQHRAKLLTIVGGGYTLGWVVAGSAAMSMIPLFGWRSVLLLGFLPLAMVPFIWFCVPESVRFYAGRRRYAEALAQIRKVARSVRRPTEEWGVDDFAMLAQQARGGPRELFGRRLILMTALIWLTYVFNMTAIYGLSTWVPSLFVKAGFSLAESYSFSIVQALGATFGAYLIGWLMDRYGRKQTLSAMYCVGGLAVLFFGFVSSLPALYVAGIGAGILVLGAPTPLNVVCGETYPTHIRSTGLGWAHAAGRIGSIVGPVLGGMLQAGGVDFRYFFVVFSLPCFVCAALLLLYRVKRRGESLEAVSELAGPHRTGR
jgi:MFS transporter, AAHS family, benzoate transport protein